MGHGYKHTYIPTFNLYMYPRHTKFHCAIITCIDCTYNHWKNRSIAAVNDVNLYNIQYCRDVHDTKVVPHPPHTPKKLIGLSPQSAEHIIWGM